MPMIQRFPSLPRLIVACASTLLVLVTGAALAGAQSSQPVEQGTLQVDGDDNGVIEAGQSVRVAGGGFAPGAEVDIVIESDPVHLATTTANGASSIDATVTIPSSMPAGEHTLKATGPTADGGLRVLAAEVVVVADGTDPGDGPGDDDDPSVGGSGDAGGTLPRTGAELGVLAAIGAAAIAGGAVLLTIRRRHLT